MIVMTAKRSVFSAEELRGKQAGSTRPMKVIDFLLAGHVSPPVSLATLLEQGVFKGTLPQSIAQLDEARYQRLRLFLKLGFEL